MWFLQLAVTDAVAGDTDAANRAIDPMQHGLVIDVNDAGMNSVGDALGAGKIGRDDCGREAILRCVGERDRLLVIPECRDWCDRSKDFFVECCHSWRYA